MISAKSEENRKLLKEAMSTPEGREILKKCYVKYFPKCSHNAVLKFIDGEISENQFFEIINNNALDAYNADPNQRKEAIAVLKASEDTRKEIKKK